MEESCNSEKVPPSVKAREATEELLVQGNRALVVVTRMNDFPLITIVTVCLNAERVIARTVRSVLEQTYPNVEYLVIDGGSTDHTLAILDKYKDRISRIVSEKDQGIYDAMNKGIDLARGKYINFMNAGDWFYESDTVHRLIASSPDDSDLTYGDSEIRYLTYKTVMPAENLNTPWFKMKFCHQSMFLRTSLARQYRFSGKYIASDFEQIHTLFQKDYRFHDAGMIVASFAHDGLHARHKIRLRFEFREIVRRDNRRLGIEVAFWGQISWTVVVELLRRLLTDPVFEWLSRLKSRLISSNRNAESISLLK